MCPIDFSIIAKDASNIAGDTIRSINPNSGTPLKDLVTSMRRPDNPIEEVVNKTEGLRLPESAYELYDLVSYMTDFQNENGNVLLEDGKSKTPEDLFLRFVSSKFLEYEYRGDTTAFERSILIRTLLFADRLANDDVITFADYAIFLGSVDHYLREEPKLENLGELYDSEIKDVFDQNGNLLGKENFEIQRIGIISHNRGFMENLELNKPDADFVVIRDAIPEIPPLRMSKNPAKAVMRIYRIDNEIKMVGSSDLAIARSPVSTDGSNIDVYPAIVETYGVNEVTGEKFTRYEFAFLYVKNDQ